ncbi:MAG: PASTA domain-containing protein [Ruminococcaceae bacterium]|nr:PASTA domain-containing protein [Oscillospiraceae bacterium]
MSNETKLCMSCMNEVPASATSCPHCGFNGSQRNPEICLPIGYRLNNRYVIGMRKDYDGDSASYVGYDCSLNCMVEVREFLPVNGCTRDPKDYRVNPKLGAELHYKTSLMDFCELFKNLAKLTSEQNIIRTTDFFEANQTAYAIMEVFDGITLREFLSLKNGKVTYEQSLLLLSPVIDALYSIHKVNLIHRGVSPDTIFISRSGFIKLGGFATSAVRTKGTEVANKLFSGYTAPEQYTTNQFQSAATDVYSIAATFYRCITGIAPQDADQRCNYDTLEPIADLAPEIPAYAAKAISMGMILNADTRAQSVLEFKKILKNEYVSAEEETDEEEREQGVSVSGRKKTKSKHDKVRLASTITIFAVCLLVVGIFVFGIWKFVLNGGQGGEAPEQQGTELVVPNYVGEDSTQIVRDNKNFYYIIVPELSSDVPENQVIRQEPAAGTAVEEGTRTTITIYRSKGNLVTMVKVTGLHYKEAYEKLNAIGVKYIIKEVDNELYTKGYVISQDIKEDEEINASTRTVTLTIAKTDENDDEDI